MVYSIQMDSMLVLMMEELLVMVLTFVYSCFDCYYCRLGHYCNFVRRCRNLHCHQLMVLALDNL